MDLTRTSGAPHYEHDCTDCRFVGHDARHAGEPQCNGVDMYVHVGPTSISLIRRYSSEPSQNGCFQYSQSDKQPRIPERYQPVMKAWGSNHG